MIQRVGERASGLAGARGVCVGLLCVCVEEEDDEEEDDEAEEDDLLSCRHLSPRALAKWSSTETPMDRGACLALIG